MGDRERQDLDGSCKDWMMDAREVSYDVEDAIDDFRLSLDRRDSSGSYKVLKMEALEESHDVEDAIDASPLSLDRSDDSSVVFVQTSSASPFRDLRIKVRDLSERCRERWRTPQATPKGTNPIVDPRSLFLHNQEWDLVEMDEKKDEIIRLLQHSEIVCIVGFAGMGKTTLADQVYQAIGEQFQCRAFVSLSPNPDIMQVCITILRQVNGSLQPTGSTGELRDFLADKRYADRAFVLLNNLRP